MNAKVQRAGMTIGPRGQQGSLGWWPTKFEGSAATGWVGRAGVARANAMKVGQRLHEQFEAGKLAVIAGQPGLLPEQVPGRVHKAREDQRALARLHEEAARLRAEVFDARVKLRPFDYEKSGTVGAMLRQERRALMRSMTPQQRMEALRKFEFREAAAEQPGQLSGLSDAEHKALVEADIERRFPEDVRNLAEASEAADIFEEALATVERALNAELRLLSEPIEEPAAAESAPEWV